MHRYAAECLSHLQALVQLGDSPVPRVRNTNADKNHSNGVQNHCLWHVEAHFAQIALFDQIPHRCTAAYCRNTVIL